MKNKLYLFLRTQLPSDEMMVTWCFIVEDEKDNGNKFEAQTGTYKEFIEYYQENFNRDKIVSIISGEFLTYTKVALPKISQRRMQQALPFIVEEDIAGNIEDSHLVSGKKKDGDWITLAIIEKSIIKSWRDWFLLKDLPVISMYGMPDLVESNDNNLHIILYDNIALAKSNDVCFQCERENLPILLESIALNNIEDIVINYPKTNKQLGEFSKIIQHEISEKEGINVEIKPYIPEPPIFLVSSEDLDLDQSINILQGEFSTTGSRNSIFSAWAPVILAIVFVTMLQVVFNLSAGLYFHHWSGVLDNRSKKIYLDAFPDEKTAVDIKSQLEGKLRQSKSFDSHDDFGRIFPIASHAIIKSGNKGDIQLRQFRFDRNVGELKIDIEAKSISFLESLRQTMISDGLHVDIISANEDKGILKATLRVTLS